MRFARLYPLTLSSCGVRIDDPMDRDVCDVLVVIAVRVSIYHLMVKGNLANVFRTAGGRIHSTNWRIRKLLGA